MHLDIIYISKCIIIKAMHLEKTNNLGWKEHRLEGQPAAMINGFPSFNFIYHKNK
jgi:hypothetical protein